LGLRRDDLIAKDGAAAAVDARLQAYQRWQTSRAAAIAQASAPSVKIVTATQLAADREVPLIESTESAAVENLNLSRIQGRPFGPLFGTLVHAALATVPLDSDEATVARIAKTQGRILLGFGDGVDEEAYAAAEVVSAVLRHPFFDRVRAADAAGRCYRELPIIWQAPDGTLIEGTVDLAFEEGPADSPVFVVLDFKTDRELDTDLERYRRQLAIYCQALAELRGLATRGILMRV
jgi:ATP-dependent exoDNAse (exonuclease V) beta subunit